VNEEVNFTPRQHISPLGAKFTPRGEITPLGASGEIKNGPQNSGIKCYGATEKIKFKIIRISGIKKNLEIAKSVNHEVFCVAVWFSISSRTLSFNA
jgi:hypothetical protein